MANVTTPKELMGVFIHDLFLSILKRACVRFLECSGKITENNYYRTQKKEIRSNALLFTYDKLLLSHSDKASIRCKQ